MILALHLKLMRLRSACFVRIIVLDHLFCRLPVHRVVIILLCIRFTRIMIVLYTNIDDWVIRVLPERTLVMVRFENFSSLIRLKALS